MKMHTGFQKIYKKLYDGTYQQYIIHVLHTEDIFGNQTTKHDKTIVGGIYKIAKPGERSVYGEAKFIDPEDGQEKLLILVKAPVK